MSCHHPWVFYPTTRLVFAFCIIPTLFSYILIGILIVMVFKLWMFLVNSTICILINYIAFLNILRFIYAELYFNNIYFDFVFALSFVKYIILHKNSNVNSKRLHFYCHWPFYWIKNLIFSSSYTKCM